MQSSGRYEYRISSIRYQCSLSVPCLRNRYTCIILFILSFVVVVLNQFNLSIFQLIPQNVILNVFFTCLVGTKITLTFTLIAENISVRFFSGESPEYCRVFSFFLKLLTKDEQLCV